MPDASGSPIAGSAGPSSARPLWIASNRLPVSLVASDSGYEARKSSGGLAAALQGVAKDAPFDWVGWPGCVVPDDKHEDVRAQLEAERLTPVFLDDEDEELYYHGVSNQALWPLFHYFVEKVDFQERAWHRYQDVNERFAQTIIEKAPKGSRVWIHDFHLMLVPRLLRITRPDLKIGFFMHIPFPSSEIYRLLPVREELLLGVLGCDYIGFHTQDYARHFRSACLRVLGVRAEHDGVQFEGRRVGVGIHPIGVDVDGFKAVLRNPRTKSIMDALAARYSGRRLILGVERLDYTKGVAHKLRAFERMLERRPELASEVAFLQIIVPSRLKNPDYAALKREIDECVGRVNGRHGRPGVTPVEYMHRSVEPEQLAALYRYADVCMVTPVRDGMNLVAQEFVLCQDEIEELGDAWRGMLVLSEFAGAAHVLARAMMANPWDLEQTAGQLEAVLDMPRAERAERMKTMAEQVHALNCTNWARQFLARLDGAAERSVPRDVQVLDADQQEALCASFAAANKRALFLDYDGTLREIVRSPEDAVPSAELLALLENLAALPNTQVHIVSGRHRVDLAAWLGSLKISLCAEHGFASRPPNATKWTEYENADLSWMPKVQALLAGVTEEVPGTRLEVKPCALAWHYRMADADYGAWRARELHSQLQQDLADLAAEIVHGHRVVEVRAAGVHKGGYVRQHCQDQDWILCVGDDRTDLDMYEALPESAHTVHVGDSVRGARYTISTPAKVRALLSALLATASTSSC